MKLSEVIAQREKKKAESAKPMAAKRKAKPTPEPVAKSSEIHVVRTRETPNPGALQFVLNSQILDYGNLSYASEADCKGDKLGEALFGLKGIENVFVMENFVTVTRDDKADWKLLRDLVWKTINSHVTLYRSNEKISPEEIDVEKFLSLSAEEKLKGVEMVLNRSIRTNLAKDGGGVEVRGIEGNVVKIHYQGACGSCPTSSTGTLQYIQTQLKQQLHSELTVKAV